MKKTVLALMIGCLLIGVNVFAAGDLIVNGNVGIRTNIPQAPLDVRNSGATDIVHMYDSADTTNPVFKIEDGGAAIFQNDTDVAEGFAIKDADGINAFSVDTRTRYVTIGVPSSSESQLTIESAISGEHHNLLEARLNAEAPDSFSYKGAQFRVFLQASSPGTYSHNINAGGTFTALDDTGGQTVTIANLVGAQFSARRQANADVATITTADGVRITVNQRGSTGTIDTATAGKFQVLGTAGTITDSYGLTVDNQYGSTKRGIWLKQDGFGGDIVFGAAEDAKIYYDGTDLIIDPGAGEKLDVEGNVEAFGFITGDITFQKDGKKLWRMFEDEEGLYIESLKTGKVYRFVLQEIEKK